MVTLILNIAHGPLQLNENDKKNIFEKNENK